MQTSAATMQTPRELPKAFQILCVEGNRPAKSPNCFRQTHSEPNEIASVHNYQLEILYAGRLPVLKCNVARYNFTAAPVHVLTWQRRRQNFLLRLTQRGYKSCTRRLGHTHRPCASCTVGRQCVVRARQYIGVGLFEAPEPYQGFCSLALPRFR